MVLVVGMLSIGRYSITQRFKTNLSNHFDFALSFPGFCARISRQVSALVGKKTVEGRPRCLPKGAEVDCK